MSIAKSIVIQRSARYFLSSEPSALQTKLCFVLHGYGQLPQYFIRKFQALNRSDILFVAPEGLHRFYLQGNAGRVGASWMTKEERLEDIADYNRMLDQIAEELLSQNDYQKIAILGFSQGVATACRWANNTRHKFDSLISWAGAFPPDLDFKAALANLKPRELHLLCGNEDEFISEERLKEHLNFLAEKGIQPQLQRFEGGHDIYKAPLEELMNRLFPTHPNP